MEKKKLILPVSIIFGCIIIGGFIYASQVKQKQMEIQYKVGQDAKLSAENYQNNHTAGVKALNLQDCLKRAEDSYNAYIAADIDKYGVQVIGAQIGIQELNIYKNAQDVCLRQYK